MSFPQILEVAIPKNAASLQPKIAGDKTFDLTSLTQIKALRPIRYANWWNVFGAGTEEKRVEKIPAATLVDAFFDISGLTAQQSMSADDLTGLIGKLPDSEGKQALLRWIQQGVTNINDLRARTNDYISAFWKNAAAHPSSSKSS